MLRRLIAFVLVHTILWTGWAMALGPAPRQAQPGAGGASPLEEIDRQLGLIESLRGTLDRSQFDLDALGERLGWDSDAIVKFVRSEIELEPYAGLLRGAAGTLMSRAGNSLDQAVLLATLLKDAGLEARIVRGELTLAQARTLLEQTRARRSPPSAPADVAAWNAIAAQAGPSSPVATAPAQSTSAELDLATETTRLLEQALRTGTARPSLNEPAILEEARDYFWVELRLGSSGPWTGEHPAFADPGVAPRDLQALEVFQDTIPAALQHQLRIAVFLERRDLDRLVVHQIVPPWERPAANLAALSFSFTNYPNGIQGDLFALDLEQAIVESELFVPVLNGEVLEGTMGFDLDGVPYDLTAMGDGKLGASSIFRTVGDRVDRAAGALGSLGSRSPARERARHLTAQWIEYTLVAPGGSETSHRRYLLDRIGAAARKSGQVSEIALDRPEPWQLLAAEEFMLAPGSYPGALTLDELLARERARLKLARELEEKGGLSSASLRAVRGESRGPDAATLLALFDAFDRDIEKRQSASTFRPEPTLLALHLELKASLEGRLSTDIISNLRRSREWRDGRTAWRDLLLQGVWETVVERRVIDAVRPPATPMGTPFSVFADLRQSPSQLLLFEPHQAARISSLGLPPELVPLLRARLEQGFSIVASSYEADRPFAWWQVDPVTGSAVGVLSDGRGAAVAEMVLLLTGVAMAVLGGLAIKTLVVCMVEENQRESRGAKTRPMECCVLDQMTTDGSEAESVVFGYAMATDTLKRQVGMDVKLCRGH